jgi:hypothetical protein
VAVSGLGRLESGQSSGDGERNLGSCGRIGIKEADAFKGELKCDFAKDIKGRAGAENYRFGKIVCSVTATARTIEVESNAAFRLLADGWEFAVGKGKNVFSR